MTNSLKFSYEYLNKEEVQNDVVRPFIRAVYGKEIENTSKATALFLEHHRKFDIGNEFAVFGDLANVRDEGERYGMSQYERLNAYRKGREVFDRYEGGFGAGGEFAGTALADYMEGFLKSPSLYISLFSGFAGKGAQMAGSKLTQEAIKQYVKTNAARAGVKPLDFLKDKSSRKQVEKFIRTQGFGGTEKYARTKAGEGALKKYALQQGSIAAGVEGTLAAGADVGRQAVEMEGKDLGLQTRDAFSLGQTALVGGLSGGIAGGLAGGLALWQAKRASSVIANTVDDNAVEAARIKKLKAERNAIPEINKRVNALKESMQKESDEFWDTVGEKGQDYLAKKFHITDFTHAQVRFEINDNLVHAMDELVQSKKFKLGPTTKKEADALNVRLKKEGIDAPEIKPMSVTRQVFMALDDTIEVDQFRKVIDKYGLTSDEFRHMWWSTISDAGKQLGAWGRFVQASSRDLAKFDEEIGGAIVQFEKLPGYGSLHASEQHLRKIQKLASGRNWSELVYTTDNFRRAMMVMQPKTGIRNLISVAGKVPMDIGARFIDNAISMAVNRATNKPVSEGVRMSDAFSMFRWTLDNAKAGAAADAVLENVDKLSRHRLLTHYSEINHALGNNTTAFTRGTQSLADNLNIVNRSQETLFRRAAFIGSLERQLSRTGILGKNGMYKNMDEFINGVKNKDGTFKVRPGPNNKAIWTHSDNFIDRAINEALEFTFQGEVGAQAGTAIGKTWLINGFDKLAKPLVRAISTPVLGTAFVPFPRFLYNAIKFQLEYSPFGLLSALTSKKTYRAIDNAVPDTMLSKGKKKVTNLTQDYSEIGKGIMGSGMYIAAHTFRESPYAGGKWDEAINERGETVSLGPIGPNIAPYLFWADFWIRTFGEGSRQPTVEEVKEKLAKGMSVQDAYKEVSSGVGPRAYKRPDDFFREAARAGIGTQARVGQLASFIDDIFVKRGSSRVSDSDITSDTSDEGILLNVFAFFKPLSPIFANYISGFATPFSVLQDTLSIYDGSEEIVRNTKTDPLVGKVKARIPKPVKNMLEGLGYWEDMLPAQDPFREDIKRKQAPFLQQQTGFLTTAPKTYEHSEFDRLGFSYRDLIAWDESPALTYAYKELIDEGLKAHRPFLESTRYQNMDDYEKAAYWDSIVIDNVRSIARSHLKLRFVDHFTDENLYEQLDILKRMSLEERNLLRSRGILNDLANIDQYNADKIEKRMVEQLMLDNSHLKEDDEKDN